MPEQNIIDVSWDLEKFDQQTVEVLKDMQKVYDLGKEISLNAIKLGSTGGFTELKAAVEQTNALSTAQNNLISTQKAAAVAVKTQTAASQKLTQEQKLQKTVTDSATGSYKQLEAQMKLLQLQYKNLSEAERNSPTGQAMAKNIDATKDNLKKLDAGLGDHQRKVGSYADAIAGSFEHILGRVLEYVGAYKLIEGVTEFLKGTVNSAIEAETALFRFKGTLDNLGRNDAFERIEKAATKLHEEFGFFERPQIIGVFEQLATFGKLSENQINDLTPVIINFAAKSGTSLKEATSIILSAIEGQGKGLKQYGINIKDAKTEVERFGLIMTELKPKVEGAAAAFGDTTQGNIEKTKIRFKELAEEIGNQVLPTINNLLKGTSALINDLKEDGIGKVLRNTIDGFTVYLFKGAAALKEYQKDRQDAINGIGEYAAVTQEEEKKTVDFTFRNLNLGDKGYGLGEYDPNKAFDPNSKGLDNTIKEKKVAAVRESTKEALDAEFELYKIAQQRKLKLLQDETNNEKNSIEERKQANLDFYNASIDLTERTAEHEVNMDKVKLAELEANLKKSKGSQRNNLLIDIENEKKLITIANAKKNDELLAQTIEYNKKQSELEKARIAGILKDLSESEKSIKNVDANVKSAIDASNAATIASLDTLLNKGKITQKFYDDEKAKSEKNALILTLQAQLSEMEGLRGILILKKQINQATQDEIDIATNNIEKQKSLITSAKNKPDEKKGLTELEKRDQVVALAKDATDAIQNLVDIGYQKEIDAIQKIIDLNNIRKDQEIANINNSTLSAQEKAAQLIILDNTVAANNHKLLVQQNQERVKQAKFDRDMAILKILEDVAGANFKLIAQGGFAGIAAGIAVGLEATAAIAQLLAKPLPTVPAYASGTDSHPGGPAYIGEAGQERVDIPGGRSFITSGPMLLNNLPKGAKVTPLTSDDINQAMYSSMMITTAQRLQSAGIPNNDRNIIEAIERGSQMTVQAMKKQKGTSVNIKVDGYWGAYITKNVRE